MANSPTTPGAIFLGYSRQDAAYLARLQRYLTPSVRSGAIPLWDNTQIKPGDDWKHSIEQALISARVALLLVSVDFLASEYVAKEELPRLLSAAEARGTRILPIILTPCLFQRTNLSHFHPINDPTRPMSGLNQHEQDLVWERAVETVLDTLNAPVTTPINSGPTPLLPSRAPSTPAAGRSGRVPDKFPTLLRELITATPGLVLDHAAKKFTSFAPREWDVPALMGANGRMFGFVFDRKYDRLQLNLIISPGPLEVRQRLLDMALAKQPPFDPVDKQLNNNWNTIYRKLFFTTQVYEHSSEEDLQREIRTLWKHFLEQDLPPIQAAMQTEAGIWQEP